VAEAPDTATFTGSRTTALATGRARLSHEQWQTHLVHAGERIPLSAAMARVIPALARASAQPLSAFGVRDVPVDVEADPRAAARVFQYALDILHLGFTPTLYVDEEDPSGIRVANVTREGQLVPAVIVGLPHALTMDERVLAFELGRALSYLKPERLVFAAFPTMPLLSTAVESLRGAVLPDEKGKWSSAVQKAVSQPVLDEVSALLRAGSVEDVAAEVATWRDAAELTANRVGLLLAGDLDLAARCIARRDVAAMTTLSVRDRLTDLVAFSVSEEYLAARRYLGIGVGSVAP
jgi:hypothetical protein